MYTGDDFNYAELIEGDDEGYSDALLGIFDAIAPAASAALSALAADDRARFHEILAPTVPLSRHIFGAPTRFYKTGVVFLAWLNGHQEHFVMVGRPAERAQHRCISPTCSASPTAPACCAIRSAPAAHARAARESTASKAEGTGQRARRCESSRSCRARPRSSARSGLRRRPRRTVARVRLSARASRGCRRCARPRCRSTAASAEIDREVRGSSARAFRSTASTRRRCARSRRT